MPVTTLVLKIARKLRFSASGTFRCSKDVMATLLEPETLSDYVNASNH